MATKKKKFLVVHDYGTGAACAFVYAHSVRKIYQLFPDFEIRDPDDPSLPPWLLKSPEHILVTDIDNLTGWLRAHYERIYFPDQ